MFPLAISGDLDRVAKSHANRLGQIDLADIFHETAGPQASVFKAMGTIGSRLIKFIELLN